VGNKLVEMTPRITRDAGIFTQRLMRERMPELQMRIRQQIGGGGSGGGTGTHMTTTSLTPPPDPAREHYPETILVVTAPGHPPFEIDLRREPEPGLARTLATLGLAGTFAVITACNPFGASP
jgi:hypothetical protein